MAILHEALSVSADAHKSLLWASTLPRASCIMTINIISNSYNTWALDITIPTLQEKWKI